MDIERRRALTRIRVQRHRAIRAGVEKLIGKQSFPRIPEGVGQVGSSSDSAEAKTLESSSEESVSNDSRTRDTELPEETLDSGKVRTGADSQEQSTADGFDLDATVSKLKSSPASSVTSRISYTENPYTEKSYTEQPLSGQVPSKAKNIECRLPNPSAYLSREPSWISSAADSNVLHLIFEGMQKLAHEQSKLTIAVNHMSSVLERLTGDSTPRKRETFEKTYKLDLPFASRESFLKFDSQLANDQKCRTSLIHSIYQKYDVKKTITKNLTAILRKFVTREVALVYTAQKCVAGKSVFKDTTFSSCLLETVDSLADDKLIAPVPDSEYFGHLGSVLSNAKDWGVARSERAAKRRRIVP